MNTPTKKTLKLTSLKFDYLVNIRDQANYDLPTMMEQIKSVGRIIKPLIVRGEDLMVLQGNRRGRAALLILEDPNCPQELRDALEKVDCIVYTGLNEQETLAMIVDHGSEKPISKSEVVEICWRMDRQFFSEAQIINLLYFALAKYTGNERKLADVPKGGKERETFLKKWFHGTLGNQILAAAKMGEYVKQQYLLTKKAEDRLLRPERKEIVNGVEVTIPAEVVEMRCSNDRITALSAAKQADLKTPEGWTSANGGAAFNALIEKFKEEDAGDGPAKSTRPSPKDLVEKSQQVKCPAIRAALLVASGDQDAGRDLFQMDDALNRMTMVMDTLRKNVDAIVNDDVRQLVRAILDDKVPAGEVDVLLTPLTTPTQA